MTEMEQKQLLNVYPQTEKVDILAIDDDKFVQKVIVRALNSKTMLVRTAINGEKGIEMANEKKPDIILLDVAMPGIDGYETCKILRNSQVTCKVPIIFLSARSSLSERMQGYEAGADDYLVKPFENENLLARINILVKYKQERISLQEQYNVAQKTAVLAMTSTNELGLAVQFLEKSIIYSTTVDLISGLFESTNQLELDCCVMTKTKSEQSWFASKEVISPIEKELLEMSDREQRFLDFGQRTIINYPMVSLLIKNMPLNDMERYGRMKDLLPIFLSAVNVKLSSIETQQALNEQSNNMLNSFKSIRRYLFHMGTTVINNREDGRAITNNLIQNIHANLLGMGLEDDQEDYVLDRIDELVDDVMSKIDAGAEIRFVLDYILTNLKSLIEQQELLLEGFSQSLAGEAEIIQNNNDIELF